LFYYKEICYDAQLHEQIKAVYFVCVVMFLLLIITDSTFLLHVCHFNFLSGISWHIFLARYLILPVAASRNMCVTLNKKIFIIYLSLWAAVIIVPHCVDAVSLIMLFFSLLFQLKIFMIISEQFSSCVRSQNVPSD